MASRILIALAVLLVSCAPAAPAVDAAIVDAAIAQEAVVIDAAVPDAAVDDDAGTSAASICPQYDVHARECFGDDTGEDFLAECFSLYTTCGDVLPAVVQCRLETACADLGSCMGMGC